MSEATILPSAVVVTLSEFQSRRAVKQMRERRPLPRRFLWTVPGTGASVVLGFQPLPGTTALGQYNSASFR